MWAAFKQFFRASQPDESAGEPVVVATCNGPIEASMMVAQLQDSGIPAATIGAESAAVFGMQTGILAEVRILVPAQYVDAARELLDELDLSTDMTISQEDADSVAAESDESPTGRGSEKESANQ